MFLSFSDYIRPFIMTHICSNQPISNIIFINLIKALDLSHCAARTILPSVWKIRYPFPGGGSLDEFGVVVVVIV